MPTSLRAQAEEDSHEPNNTKLTATEIERDTVYSGIVSAPWISDVNRPEQDWYAVHLEAGAMTMGFTAVPSQGRIGVNRVNPAGATTYLGMTEVGAIETFPSFTVPEAGTYYFVIAPSGSSGMSGAVGGAKPTYLTEPYSFRVTQP
jgi:hypothetical protein